MSKDYFRLEKGLAYLEREKAQIDKKIGKLNRIIKTIEGDLQGQYARGLSFADLVKNGWRSHGYKYFHYEALKDEAEAYAHVSLILDRRIKMTHYEINRPRRCKSGGAE